MCALRRAIVRRSILGLFLLTSGCGPARAPALQSRAVTPDGAVARGISRSARPAARPRPAKPVVDACAIPPTGRGACGGARDGLTKRWNGFYRWLQKRGYHRRSYGNTRQFTTRVGDAIVARLRKRNRGHRMRAFRLAIMLLGLRARTVRGTGSRWDCTTRMLQLTAQARKLASMGRISYTGYRDGRIRTVSGRQVYRGYHVSRQVITLMAVAHYKDRRLARRNMAWRTPLLGPGEIWKRRHYESPRGRLRVGDILWYPTFGPGHFGTVLHRGRDFFVTVEGYWRGQPTVIHIYKRHDRIADRCVRRDLARLRGFSALFTGHGAAATWAKNVYSGLIDDKGPLRVGRHR